jgi:iron complex outermembrane recepter protein
MQNNALLLAVKKFSRQLMMLSFFFSFLISLSALADDRIGEDTREAKTSCHKLGTITGTVISTTGVLLESVTITIKGKRGGETTDKEGKFSIEANRGDILIISSVGYETKFLKLTAATDYTIKLSKKEDNFTDVTVVGSRARPRTDVNRSVPVDVISAKEMIRTGQIDLGQMIQFTSPSFNSAKTGINGVANFADPASLRGMSPDQSLVLINGKRRHQFSAINNNVTVGKGTVVTDLNGIPAMAIERTEILRDGAAAQYGSDAIAGIINLALKSNVNSGTFTTQFGATQKSDGATGMGALNYGFKLNKPGSFINFTLHYQFVAGTDRSDPYKGTIYDTSRVKDDSIRNVRGVWPTSDPKSVTEFGSNQTKAYQGFVNFSYPINDKWSVYSFGGASKKDIKAFGFFRTANPRDPNSNPSIFPDGYRPILPGISVDYSGVVGVSKKVEEGWNVDISSGYGLNYLDILANNTANPSLGAASPTSFYVGRTTFGQSTSEINFSRSYDYLPNIKSINIAFGGQLRIDNFKLAAGDSASYIVGPLALSNGKAPGASGRPGISPADVTNASRTNIAAYVDIETDLTDKWLVAAAGRYENYSDFGGNLSGKLATRLKLSKNFALRASVNRGFRAPSLQQIFNSQSTSTVQAGFIRQTKQLPSNDPRLKELGIADPKPELSWNYNVGITAKAGKKLLFTLDAYQIDVKDRIIISEQFAVNAAIPNLLKVFPTTTGIREVTFFTNAIDTRTMGIDLVTSFKHNFNQNSSISTNLAMTVNKTEIVAQKKAPDSLTRGATVPVKLLDTVSIGLIEKSQPRTKVLLSATYQLGPLSFTARGSYFGEVTAWEKPRNLPHRSQTFTGKTLLDALLEYQITKRFSIIVGSNNIFDVYPDKNLTNYSSYTDGQIPYTRNASQFGFNGAYYYTTLTVKL